MVPKLLTPRTEHGKVKEDPGRRVTGAVDYYRGRYGTAVYSLPVMCCPIVNVPVFSFAIFLRPSTAQECRPAFDRIVDRDLCARTPPRPPGIESENARG